MSTPKGWCNICGTHGELSEEHIPPRKAFNNSSVFEGHVNYEDGTFIKGRKLKQSVQYTICDFCNNFTSMYASTYVDVAKQAAIYTDRMNFESSTDMIIHDFHPLRLIKYIVTAMFVVNGDKFREKNPELVNFVLNKNSTTLPTYCKVYMNLAAGSTIKLCGVSVAGNLYTEKFDTLSCVEFYPLSIGMSFDSESPFNGYYDISHLSNFRHQDKKSSMRFRVKKLNTDDRGRMLL